MWFATSQLPSRETDARRRVPHASLLRSVGILSFPELALPELGNPFAFNPCDTGSPRTILSQLTVKLRSPRITKSQTTTFHL